MTWRFKTNTPSVSNYSSFDFFDPKFDYSSYSKNCAKYHFFYYGLFYQYKFFKNDLNLTTCAQPSGQTWSQKSQTNYNLKLYRPKKCLAACNIYEKKNLLQTSLSTLKKSNSFCFTSSRIFQNLSTIY